MKGRSNREIDSLIYKNLLYQLEIKKVFLDSELSLKKLSAMIDTNQTYLSNVVNRYFECNLKGLLNRYRVEYAKELLRAGCSILENLPKKCGFASKTLSIQLLKNNGNDPHTIYDKIQTKQLSPL